MGGEDKTNSRTLFGPFGLTCMLEEGRSPRSPLWAFGSSYTSGEQETALRSVRDWHEVAQYLIHTEYGDGDPNYDDSMTIMIVMMLMFSFLHVLLCFQNVFRDASSTCFRALCPRRV